MLEVVLLSRPVVVGGIAGAVACSLVIAPAAHATVVIPPPVIPGVTAVAAASTLTLGGALAIGGAVALVAGGIWWAATEYLPDLSTSVDDLVLAEDFEVPVTPGSVLHYTYDLIGWQESDTVPGQYSVRIASQGNRQLKARDLCVAGPNSTHHLYPPGSVYDGGFSSAHSSSWVDPVMTIHPCGSVAYYMPEADWQAVAIAFLPSVSGTVSGDAALFVNPFVDVSALATSFALRSTRTCVDPVTSDVSTVTATGPPGDFLSPVNPCPEGSIVTSETWDVVGVEGTRTLQTTLGMPLPARPVGSVAMKSSVPTEYPNCWGSPCSLWVELDGVPLHHGNPDAPYWWTISRAEPERISCRWGGAWGSYAMPLADCEPLKYAYETAHGVVADPAREYELVPALSPAGDPWPVTNPLPQLEPQPQPTPTATPAAIPQTGVNPSPAPAGDPSILQCIGATWSWNPISWVYAPVKCVLVELFQPRPDDVAALRGQVEDAYAATSLPAWLALPAALIPSIPSSGCMGPAMALPDPFNITIYPLAACDPPMSGVAAVCKAGLSAVLVLSGVRACLSMVLAGFGYGAIRSGGSDE